MSSDLKDMKRVLVLMPDKHMGNLVVSLPSIVAAKEFFEERGKAFYLVIDEAYREIVDSIIEPRSLILYPRKKIHDLSALLRTGIMLTFLRLLRKVSPDVVIDLEGRHSSSIMAFLLGASLRVGKASGKRAYLYNWKVEIPRGVHRANTYMAIIRALGIETDIKIPYLHSSQQLVLSLHKILAKEGITLMRPVICVHPGAGKIYKQWTLAGFAEVCDWLSSEGFDVILVGGEKDRSNVQEIKAMTKASPYDLSGKLSLGELISLCKISSLYIGNDSGPMHIAAAVGIPVVALFGPSDEKRWYPFSKDSIVLRGEAPCEQCKGKHCQYEFRCIKNLSVDRVRAAVEEILNRKVRED